jgi:hypothetical protein
MLKRIQDNGRSLLIFSPAEEVLTLAESLKPEGLAIFIEQSPPPAELDALFDRLQQPY